MGTIVAVYSEVQKRFLRLWNKIELPPESVRYTLGTRMRYLLGSNILYIPEAISESLLDLRLCWARISPETDIDPVLWDSEITQTYDLSQFDEKDVRIGNRYTKRQKEYNGRFVEVETFCSQILLDALVNNPEVLSKILPEDFENLCAELFVRRGFKVDLFRTTKDGGIDFLAVNDEQTDPIIFAVQCKQPEINSKGKRKSVGRPILQQIYGAAKAWDLEGGIVISGSTYSREARRFSNHKPGQMILYNQTDILKWIEKYRWNEDEICE